MIIIITILNWVPTLQKTQSVPIIKKAAECQYCPVRMQYDRNVLCEQETLLNAEGGNDTDQSY